MAYDTGNSSVTNLTYLPNQIKDNFGKDDYIATLRFIASRYNLPTYMVNKWSIKPSEIGLPLGFASRCEVWRNYYFGEQNNMDYNHLTLKEDGTRKLLKLFRGKDIFKYINYTIEPIIDIAKRVPKILSCSIISENVVSQRRLMLDIGKFMADQQQMTQYMNEKYQMYFETANGIKFLQDAGKNLQAVDFREDLSTAASNIAKDVYYRNYMDEVMIETGKDALITGLAGVKVDIVNGYVCVEQIPSNEAIFPPSAYGDQHRRDAFGGRMRFLTVQEVAALYGRHLTKEQLDEVQSIATNQGGFANGFNSWSYLNSLGSNLMFNWWDAKNGVPRIAVIEAQWASYRKDDADEQRQCLRQGILIGNKFLIEDKITTNITKDWRNPSHTLLDYIFCQPMSVFGKNMGIPEILYTYQNRVDFLQTKLDDWINQTKGTFYLINGSYLDEGVDATQIMSNISDMRIEVVKGMDTDAGETIQKFMQQGAIEMPRDTINVINQVSQYRQMMADILNIPDAARGIIDGYVPAKTLNFQQSQSGKGTRYFYDPLFTFYKRVFQKAVDKFKVSTLDNPTFEYNLIISDSQSEIFKSTKEFGLSQMAVYLGFEDIADDGYKQRMLDMMFAYAQNPQSGYTLADYSNIESMETKNEIKNYLQFRDFEIKQERMAAEEAAAAQQAELAAANNATQENITAMNNEGANARTEAQIQSNEAIKEAEMLNQQPPQ